MPPEPTAQTTIIGSDTHIKGDMTFDSTARVLGTFEGNITAKGELQVAEGATCKASVEAGKIVVDGLVEGNITARERVELNAKARIRGDVVAARLVVADGASVSGRVLIGPDAAKGAAHKGGDIGGGVETKPTPTVVVNVQKPDGIAVRR